MTCDLPMNLENPTHAPAGADGPEGNAGSGLGRDISAGVFKNYLVYLFLLGLIIRAGFMVEHARSPSFGVVTLDQKYYDTAARMLLAGDDLHLLRGIRPLLYPLFLAANYKLAGRHGIDLAIAMQHLAGVLTGLLVALLGARLFRHRLSGLAGGTLYLLAPVPLYFEGELLVESTYIFLICLALLLLLHAPGLRGGISVPAWLVCGGLLALATQERSNIFIFIVVFPVLACWQWRRSRRLAALRPVWGLIGALAMAIPWGFANKLQTGHFQLLPVEGGVNLYLGNKQSRDGAAGMIVELNRRVNYSERYEDSVEIWARQGYQEAMRAQGREPEKNPMAISHYWTHRALDAIQADPGAWLRLMAKKCWLMLWNAEIPNNKSFAFLQTEFLWLRFLPVRWVVLLMLAPAGIWAAFKWGNRSALFALLFYAGLYSAVNVVFFICDRYRYPVWPVMAAVAGGGLLAVIEAIRQRRWSSALGCGAGMGLMAAISLPNWFGANLPNFARDYLFRSIACYETGHFPEALSDIDRSVALDPNDVTALQQRGNVLLALKQYGEAGREYAQTLKIETNDAGIWNNYGIALDGLDRPNDALQAYRRATECHPPSESAFLGVAFEEMRMGRADEAAAALDQLDKQAYGPNPMALAVQSIIARQRGESSQAATLEQKARSLDPAAADWAIKRAGGKTNTRPADTPPVKQWK
jgi:4-amino-4-deoxy-L-arabinose transferase-like glycosyltransferase